MGLFRRWKHSSKHKKLSEDKQLTASINELCEDVTEEEVGIAKTFNVKFLGSAPITADRSKDSTSELIKSVMASTKTPRKKLPKVDLKVSSEGIEVVDSSSNEALFCVSIYKISYCSADSAYSNVFAFIGSDIEDTDENSEKENLTCYAFLCGKRKIAHDVTLSVARCFENAYKNWQNSAHMRKLQKVPEQNQKTPQLDVTWNSEDDKHELLIDLAPIKPLLQQTRDTSLLQNTWVSFDEEPSEIGLLAGVKVHYAF